MTAARFTIIFIIISYTCAVYGQQDEFINLSLKHYSDQKNAMIILGTWGLVNAITGGIAMMRTTNQEMRSFYQMNLGWGLVNTAIAGLGYYSAMNGQLDPHQPLELLRQNEKIKSILLLNAGLDVAYMVSGLYLIERSRRNSDNADRWRGFGKSIILQGAFLFAFDLGVYLHFNKNTNEVIKLFSQGGQMGLIINF